jgi:hypothetical protein
VNAYTTSSVWTSTDGFKWTTVAVLLPFVAVQLVEHRGWIYALGYTPDGGAYNTAQHGGLEVYASPDGGASWIRPGVVVSLSTNIASATAAQLRAGTRITAIGNAICFSTNLGGTLEAVILGDGA